MDHDHRSAKGAPLLATPEWEKKSSFLTDLSTVGSSSQGELDPVRVIKAEPGSARVSQAQVCGSRSVILSQMLSEASLVSHPWK